MAALFHVAQVVPRVAPSVCVDIRGLGFEVIHPTKVEARRIRHRGWTQALVSLTPGYLFTRFDPRADDWRPICSIRGVNGLLGESPERPFSIPDRAMQDFLRDIEAEQSKPIPVPGIAPGTRGRVAAGPFLDKMGQCSKNDGKHVSIWLELLGRVLLMPFPVDDVVAA